MLMNLAQYGSSRLRLVLINWWLYSRQTLLTTKKLNNVIDSDYPIKQVISNAYESNNEPYKYYVSESKLQKTMYDEFNNVYSSLFDIAESKTQPWTYFSMYVDIENCNKIEQFENQLKEITEITKVLKDANKVFIIYKNITDTVYLLSFNILNSGSNNATIELSLAKVNGEQITDTNWKRKEVLMQIQSELFNSSTNLNDTLSSNFMSEIYNIFSNNSIEDSFEEQITSLGMDKILQMSRIDNKTFKGEMLAHSYSNEDQVFWFVAVKSNLVYLAYFDLAEFTLK